MLDANFNARLGDVGVAAELPKDATHCTATANIVYGTEGYEDPYSSRPEGNAKVIRRKENDIFSLGVGKETILIHHIHIIFHTTWFTTRYKQPLRFSVLVIVLAVTETVTGVIAICHFISGQLVMQAGFFFSRFFLHTYINLIAQRYVPKVEGCLDDCNNTLAMQQLDLVPY